MAISSVGTLGTGAHSTNASSYTFNTATNALAAGEYGILVNVTDNTSTTDGNNNEHTSVSGGTGNWTKLGEYTNSPGGVAADGVTTSVWLFEATGTVSTGTTITLGYTSNRVDKTCSFWKFTVGAGNELAISTGFTNPVSSEVTAAAGFGSSSFSGLTSREYLFVRGLGKEANSTTQITPSSGFTAITAQRSRNNVSAVLVRGEFDILTGTGATSNPTLAVTGDTAGLFVALQENLGAITGTLAATEVGNDAFASTGTVLVKGSLAVTETGTDTFASTGKVIVKGSLAVSETGTDVFAATGTVSSGVSGSMAAIETGTDTFTSVGSVTVQGALAAVEALDSFDASGSILVQGSFTAVETGQDTFSASGSVLVSGAFAALETGSDQFEAVGGVLVSGPLAATEEGQDVFLATSAPISQGVFSATESGDDVFTAIGTTSSISSGRSFGGVARFGTLRPSEERARKKVITQAKAAIQKAKIDPALVREAELKALLREAYLAYQELIKYKEIEARNRLLKEWTKLRELEVELAQRAEEEEMELLAANLW